jgi:hypothetical protein
VGVNGNNNEIPESFELKQNFPNPFNPNTIIDYSVPKEGKISLEVFDVSGRMISTLVNEVKLAGNYKYDFNAGSLATGVYFYKLTGDGFTGTRKMILVK